MNADLPRGHIDFYFDARWHLSLSDCSTNALSATAACHIRNIEMDHVSLLWLIHCLTMNLSTMTATLANLLELASRRNTCQEPTYWCSPSPSKKMAHRSERPMRVRQRTSMVAGRATAIAAEPTSDVAASGWLQSLKLCG